MGSRCLADSAHLVNVNGFQGLPRKPFLGSFLLWGLHLPPSPCLGYSPECDSGEDEGDESGNGDGGDGGDYGGDVCVRMCLNCVLTRPRGGKGT